MANIDEERIETRRKAQERLATIKLQNAKALEDYAKMKHAEAAKTARLRALRLAKEAADKAALPRVPDIKTLAAQDAVSSTSPAPKRRAPRTPKAALRGQGET